MMTTFLVKYKKMKTLSLFLLTISTLLLYNCEEPVSVVENQLIENIYLFDIGNKGSSADLCLTFTNTQTAQISSYRIMLIPEEQIDEFTASKAFLLAHESYTESPITSNKNNIIYFKNQLDTEGDLIIPNKNYIAKIMMIGEKFNQLSFLSSNTISLINQAPLTGYYEGRLRTNMTESGAFLSPGKERILTVSGTIKQLEDPEAYSGSFQFRIPNNNFGNKIDFKTTLVPYKVNTSWIEGKLFELKEVLNLDSPPDVVPTCEKCAYLKGGKNYF